MTNEAVPPLIDCARVLHYALVGPEVRYTPKNAIYVDGIELGAVPRLAIVRNLVDDDFMLFHCDADWSCLGVSDCGSIEDAMAHANRRYEGLAGKWREAPYSDAEFAKAVTEQYGEERCSFCSRFHFQIDAPVIKGDRARICGDCIERLHSAIDTAGGFAR